MTTGYMADKRGLIIKYVSQTKFIAKKDNKLERGDEKCQVGKRILIFRKRILIFRTNIFLLKSEF